MRLILASSSPRRRELLAREGVAFDVVVAEVCEVTASDWPPRDLCAHNARIKAEAIAERNPDDLILAADTIVVLEGKVFGKPASLAEAAAMLEALAGRIHEVLTAVHLLHHATRKVCRFTDSTRVQFRPANAIDIPAYLSDINPLDKAGAYAAQEDRGRLIATIEGSMDNVVGLPVARAISAVKTHFPQAMR